MIWHEEEQVERRIFGVPAVLTKVERVTLLHDLEAIWATCYGQGPGDLKVDLRLCKKYFDPVARGQTLRQRLSQLGPCPDKAFRRLREYGEPLTIVVSTGVLLAGVECRLMIELLRGLVDDGEGVILREKAAQAEHIAMDTYREWGIARLHQVINLRAGTGPEVMQAVAVGLVLALLVNRSDTPERAVVRWDSATPDGKDVDQALYRAAERFAMSISPRAGRTQGDKRLKGGYGLTEARRRLAHRLEVIPHGRSSGSRIFIPQKYRDEVVSFVAGDLSRRSSLSLSQLKDGFDQLVEEFRASSRALAYRSMIFERASETDRLRSELIEEFNRRRSEF